MDRHARKQILDLQKRIADLEKLLNVQHTILKIAAQRIDFVTALKPLLLDKGLITNDEVQDYLDRFKEAQRRNAVQSEERSQDHGGDGDTGVSEAADDRSDRRRRSAFGNEAPPSAEVAQESGET